LQKVPAHFRDCCTYMKRLCLDVIQFICNKARCDRARHCKEGSVIGCLKLSCKSGIAHVMGSKSGLLNFFAMVSLNVGGRSNEFLASNAGRSITAWQEIRHLQLCHQSENGTSTNMGHRLSRMLILLSYFVVINLVPRQVPLEETVGNLSPLS
jgi:hypothetical protein